MSKRVLLTGGSGFVGANLTRRLLDEGHELHLLLRPGYRRWRVEDVLAHVQAHEIDMADSQSLGKLVAELEPEWIFHLATHGAYSEQSDASRIVETNVVGFTHLIEACARRGFEAFVNAGTSSEYGLKDHAPTESEGIEPNSAYAVTKAAATQYCRYLARRFGLHIPTLRLYSVYGPFEAPTRLLPQIIVRGLRGKLPPLTAPETARDFVYVDDVVDAFIAAASRPTDEMGAIFNVGTGIQTTLREVVELARRVLEISTEPQWGSMESRSWDTEVWRSDCTKAHRELAWRSGVTLEDGFSRTVDWLRSHPERLSYYQSAGGVVSDEG